MRAYYGLRANHRELALRAWLYRVAQTAASMICAGPRR